MEAVTERLMELMKIGYPELTDRQAGVKIRRWFNTPNPYLGNLTPKELCEKGKEDKVLLFIKRFFDGDMP